ncbi:MAG: AraC family transcriptional regulator [Capnocytophaga sp.]|nr:AraC family transcriptional regulator [Capnocytophaga sp.]
MNPLIVVEKRNQNDFLDNFSVPNYCIFAFEGKGSFSVDFTEYEFQGKTLLFLTPYQHFQIVCGQLEDMALLQFHGDFYCIEYHKKEVACNGLLFNNIFLMPHIHISTESYREIRTIFDKITNECISSNEFSQSVLKSYLQLVLALSSKEKSMMLNQETLGVDHNMASEFQSSLEKHYCTERSVMFYAGKAGLTVDAFSKKIKQSLGKTPTKLIQERVVLEAKKKLHLTHKSIKEIAYEMNFEDEFYFSRFFKKAVGQSPKHFRENVGLSVVAK